MTRRRKTLLVVLAIVLLAGGGFAWYWQATAVDRQANALLDELRDEEPGTVERWLIKLGLMKDRNSGRHPSDVIDDLVDLGPSAVPRLIAALKDEDVFVRRGAAKTLGKLGDVRVVEPLIAVLKDEDSWVRYDAAEALGKLGDTRAVEPLIAALKDEEEDVRHSVVLALGKLGDARAIDPLKAILEDKDEDWQVRDDAAWALEWLGVDTVKGRAELRKETIANVRKVFIEAAGEGLLDEKDTDAVKLLITALKDENAELRRCAARALGQRGDARAVKPLEALLEDGDAGVREAAREALKKLGNHSEGKP